MDILDSSPQERLRQWRYRTGQALVFALPVLALQVWGAQLGGPGAEYWVGALQGLLAGWVVYVSGAGMLVEGILRLTMRRRPGADFFVAAVAIALYAAGVVDYAGLLVRGRLLFPLTFVWSALLLMLWSATRWWLQRRNAPAEADGKI